mmetsp:Transcript_46890/g.84680  ORF Transcript_46890/g.84680 Transcript_46890/m.84680 type:complete len:116 (-) Transcript_46890:62-409(-)
MAVVDSQATLLREIFRIPTPFRNIERNPREKKRYKEMQAEAKWESFAEDVQAMRSTSAALDDGARIGGAGQLGGLVFTGSEHRSRGARSRSRDLSQTRRGIEDQRQHFSMAAAAA